MTEGFISSLCLLLLLLLEWGLYMLLIRGNAAEEWQLLWRCLALIPMLISSSGFTRVWSELPLSADGQLALQSATLVRSENGPILSSSHLIPSVFSEAGLYLILECVRSPQGTTILTHSSKIWGVAVALMQHILLFCTKVLLGSCFVSEMLHPELVTLGSGHSLEPQSSCGLWL